MYLKKKIEIVGLEAAGRQVTMKYSITPSEDLWRASL